MNRKPKRSLHEERTDEAGAYRTRGVAMLRLLLLLSLLLAAGFPLYAQDDPDEGSGEEEEEPGEFDEYDFELIEETMNYRVFQNLGIGYTISYGMLDLGDVDALGARFGIPELPSSMIVHGGGVLAGGILPIKTLRVGFNVSGGAVEASGDTSIADVPYRRRLRYSEHLYAGQIDYGLFVGSIDGLMIFPGIVIGAHRTEIELGQSRSDSVPYDHLFDPARFDTNSTLAAESNRYQRMTRSSFHLQPVLNIDYAVNKYIMFRLGGGYAFNIGNDWSKVGGTPVVDAPEFKAGGLNVHAGIFLGFFLM